MWYLDIQYIIKMLEMSSTRLIVLCGDVVRLEQKIMLEKQKVSFYIVHFWTRISHLILFEDLSNFLLLFL